MAGAPNDEMSCRELVEVVTDYLEGKLPVADRVRLEEHLAECPYCAEYIAQMRETIDALGELPGAESLDPRTEEDLGALKGNKGDQQYDIPRGLDLGRYSTVVIWCRAFSVNFARAPLGGPALRKTSR